MELRDLIELAQAEALSTKLAPTEESFWRTVCRYYSSKFSTPLPQVMAMDPEEVLTHYYEDRFSDLDPEEQVDKILDTIYSLEDPNYEAEKEAEIEEFVRRVEEEENQKFASKEAVLPKEEEGAPPAIEEAPSVDESKPPTSGYINLSYLEDEESGSGGFDL